jgi:HEPN domain-containing protein
MPPDPVRAVDARAWPAKAAQDLRRVDLLLAADPPDPEGGLFHSQQAAEKALKGFLTRHDAPFRRVHELDELGEQCVGIDSSLAEVMGRADALTKYAWRFRYPGAPYEPTLDEGRTACDLAREVASAHWDPKPGCMLRCSFEQPIKMSVILPARQFAEPRLVEILRKVPS